ncbi:MAG TPA: site-2 protease family protein [Pyrinomonadaceae bacterium]|nr:site-2 protease family protein [Pyrinomonadaceae bacterium]
MKAQIKLFNVSGIQIGLHYSWLLIAVLIAFSLAAQFAATNPRWGAGLIWGLAIVTTVLFFATIIIHELSHAAVAKARGLPVRSITLFALGGVAQIEKEPSDARTEFWMGIAGPITSAIIGMVCLGAALFLGWSPLSNQQSPLAAMLGWLGAINLMLAIFNMVPGFPLDGGRVLRAIIWWITGNPAQAIRIASGVGQVVAFAFILLGLFRFFNGAGFAGLWLTFIGWFLLDAARSTYAQFEMMNQLRGVNVRDVMTSEWPTVDTGTTLETFVNDYLLRSGRRSFITEADGQPTGMITTHEVKEIKREQWPQLRVADAMIPLPKLHAIKPTASVNQALEIMGREDVNQLPVMSNGRLEGIVSRADILRLLQTRMELNTDGGQEKDETLVKDGN